MFFINYTLIWNFLLVIRWGGYRTALDRLPIHLSQPIESGYGDTSEWRWQFPLLLIRLAGSGRCLSGESGLDAGKPQD